MNEQNFAEAQTIVEKLLDLLEVKRVVSVDDINDKSISLADVIAAANSMEDSILLHTFPEIGESISCDQKIRAEQIRRKWTQLDTTSQMELGKALVIAAHMHDGDNEANDMANMSIMSDIIPKDKLTCLSLKQWKTQREQLLKDSMNQHTLFLFDQDFSKEGGGREEGITIIKKLLKDDTKNLICALLTHTVTPAEQLQRQRELSVAHDINPDRFILIPKLHISEAPIQFAHLLMLSVLAPDFTELKLQTSTIINNAAQDAAKQVEEISIDDLYHIVFQVPAKEGIWEPDMLFRLYAMFHRLKSRCLAHDDGKLEAIAARLRIVRTKLEEKGIGALTKPRRVWELQRKELYEDGDYINKNHLPLELGDIFEKVGGNSQKKYILLAQPCDLMVRSCGKRQPELLRIPLAEIVQADKKKPPYWKEMPYFGPSHENHWFVNFKRIHSVCECLLDLCVFNQDGVAELTVGGDAPSGIRPAWEERYKYLSKRLTREAEKAAKLFPDGEDGTVDQFNRKIAKYIGIVNLFFGDDLFKGKLTTKPDNTHSITFNCKRVERLSRDRAIEMLMLYTATLARPAYDLPFGNVPVQHDI
ncbi:MAG: hypothetical protein LBC63_03025 [Holophagales bacterium]|jgi:hypothetical protein|nr:hypothetical protein [Holophagales bacterium]